MHDVKLQRLLRILAACDCAGVLPLRNNLRLLVCHRTRYSSSRLPPLACCAAQNKAHKEISMKRSKIDIIYDMLRVTAEKGGHIKPTHLLYKSNLSHQRMKLYLDELKEKHMLVEKHEDERMLYEITDIGRKFLQELQQMKEFTEAFGL